jgi:hypothetical protein
MFLIDDYLSYMEGQCPMRQDKKNNSRASSHDDCYKQEKKQVIDWELLSNFMIAMPAIVNPVEKIPLWVAVTSCAKLPNSCLARRGGF